MYPILETSVNKTNFTILIIVLAEAEGGTFIEEAVDKYSVEPIFMLSLVSSLMSLISWVKAITSVAGKETMKLALLTKFLRKCHFF